MALLDSTHCAEVWADGQADKASLYALRNVTAADTIDLSVQFSVIKRALVMGTTSSGAAPATFAGTIVTIPSGLNADAGYMLVWGASA